MTSASTEPPAPHPEALGREWQRLETKLCREHGANADPHGLRRGVPEGREMRALEHRLTTADSTLYRKVVVRGAQGSSRRVVTLNEQAKSADGARAVRAG